MRTTAFYNKSNFLWKAALQRLQNAQLIIGVNHRLLFIPKGITGYDFGIRNSIAFIYHLFERKLVHIAMHFLRLAHKSEGKD